MRRWVIQTIMPMLLCAMPFLAAGVVAAAIEVGARDFYIKNITWMDIIILSMGSLLFFTQMMFAWTALQWRGTNFDERPDNWLSNLAQAAEWFPLLGLLGTVAAILQTFSSITKFTPQEIIANYAPAITATGSGLFMSLINILPSWMVTVGRDLIKTLSGVEVVPPPVAVVAPPRADSGRLTRPSTGTDAGS